MGKKVNTNLPPSNDNSSPIRVTAGVIEQEGKILIAQRKKGDRLEGKWEFPGGKIEVGESPEACLQRELHEEFGIESEVSTFICESDYQYPNIHILLLAYHVQYLSGIFQLHNHAAIRWVTLEEMKQFDFASADLPIIEALKNPKTFI